MSVRKTREQFIEEAKEKHGEKFDYSLVVYKNTDTKVKIICPKHGEFEQTPYIHLKSKVGCTKCAREITNKVSRKKKTTEQFIQDAKKIHGDVYDYSLVDYQHSKKKVKIICKTHGIFEQKPNQHLNGQGCYQCGIDRNTKNQTKTHEQFINDAKKVHGNKYDYSKAKYIRGHDYVTIICKEHGEFKQTPAAHLSGKGCRICSGYMKKTTEEFIELSRNIHGDRYDYSEVEYKSTIDKVIIKCKEHGKFIQTPKMHLLSRGCPICSHLIKVATYHKILLEDLDKIPGHFYILSLSSTDENFLKIGISSKLSKRIKEYKWDGFSASLKYSESLNMKEAILLEQKLLRKFKKYKYNPMKKFGGSTECFVLESLPIIKKEIGVT